MADFIVTLVLALIIGAAVCYIIKAKKRGVKCIGCPAACNCAGKSGASGCGGCHGGNQTEGGCNCHTDK